MRDMLKNVTDENVRKVLETLIGKVEKLEAPATIHFAKTQENAKVPSRRKEDAGFDMYACFEQDILVIRPSKVRLVPTGIATAFGNEYVFKLSERGSTGTKNMAQRCGVIDSGFRGEIKAPINNTSDKVIVITKLVDENGKPLSEDKLPDNITELTKKDKTAILNKDAYLDLVEDAIIYPYSKAVTQGILYYIPETTSDVLDYETLKNIASERGAGMLGSSGK